MTNLLFSQMELDSNIKINLISAQFNMPMELCTKVLPVAFSDQERVKCSTVMALAIKVTGCRIPDKAMECIRVLLASTKLTKGIGDLTTKMAGVKSNMLMDHHILAIGNMI